VGSSTSKQGEQAAREARVAGLRDFQTPSFDAVERRRIQLWVLASVVLVTVAIGFVALATWPSQTVIVLRTPVLRIGLLALSLIFCAYVIEKEVHLGRLTRMLADERVLTAALTNRLHEVSLLFDAARAMNAGLDLASVLDTILSGATDLLGANGGSVMLLDGDELVAVAVVGREDARGTRLRLGEGVAGHVALRREALLIDGHVDPREFPGLADRAPYVESAMSVPLVHRDELMGVLNLNAALGRAFTEYDLRALAVFAEQASTAVANARLYERERGHVAELLALKGGETS
jgi:putative methionine-R-sulfoxide reductase with GAF domain